jgi:uncharacterized protein
MLRLLQLFTLGLAVWLVLRLVRNTLAKTQRSPHPRTPRQDRQKSNNTVRCAHCGVFLPEAEARHYQGHYYCSRQHLEADTRK